MKRFVCFFLVLTLCIQLTSCKNAENKEGSEMPEGQSDSIVLPSIFSVPEDVLGTPLETGTKILCPGVTERKVVEPSLLDEELKNDRDYLLTDTNGLAYWLPETVTEEDTLFMVKVALMNKESEIINDVIYLASFDGNLAEEEVFAAMDKITQRLIEVFGEPVTYQGVSNRYWGNDKAKDALAESMYLWDQWGISDTGNQSGFGIVLKTRLVQFGKTYTVTVQYSLSPQ